MKKELFEILKERGYVKDLTDEETIKRLVNGPPMTFYLGIDPTADSLHIGHFFALTLFKWLQDFGHHGIILIGGATALIGDPTGKSDMRKMLTKEQVQHNKNEVKELIKRFINTDGDNKAIIVDNADWICDKTYVDFMRDVGVFFNVNTMLAADCYKKRQQAGGLTFLEMGYMLMQAFDFIHLNKEFNCTLQIGGSDQWANILAGVDLSRKMSLKNNEPNPNLAGWTCPLLIKADGEKMGKTASGTLWVSREKTTVFDFYQAWMNSFDEDVERSLTFFTRMEVEEIKAICKKDIREAKKLLAFEVTKLVHGEENALAAKKAAEELFSGSISATNIPTINVMSKNLNKNIIDFLVDIKFLTSKSEVKRLLAQNGLRLNKELLTDPSKIITESDFKDNSILLQKGKKTFLKVVLTEK
ncbi:MAG: tyrosine--tRNA ligase [Tenericutes bacterium]|nr:tyrosine--tRNA ligase [Mycoplasmatota bacterium]